MGSGGTGRKARARSHPEAVGVCGQGTGGREREWRPPSARGKLNGCVASSGEREAPPTWGCLRVPSPNSKPGTYLMAFFSLRPRPESGVPAVSKEFL